MKPKAIPSTILKVSGIRTIIKKAGIASEISLKSIWTIPLIIKLPIIIKIGAITSFGIKFINGINNNEIKSNNPDIRDVKPVFPPAAIPAVPSTVETDGLVPNKPQAIVDKAIAFKALFCFSGVLSNPLICPCNNPIFSNTKTKVNEKVEIQNGIVKNALKSKLRKILLYSLKLGSEKVSSECRKARKAQRNNRSFDR